MKGNQPDRHFDLGIPTPCYLCGNFRCVCQPPKSIGLGASSEWGTVSAPTNYDIPSQFIQKVKGTQEMIVEYENVKVTIEIAPHEGAPQDPPKSRQDCIHDLVSDLKFVSERVNQLWTGTEHERDTNQACLILDAVVLQLRALAKLED